MKKALTAVTDKKILLVPAYCFCCRSTTRHVIVQSRSGGFTSKDCEICGRSRLLSRSELPAIDCQRCNAALEATYDFDRNYAYRCVSCRSQFRLWDVVPRWSELFEYCGLALDSDFERENRALLDAIRARHLREGEQKAS